MFVVFNKHNVLTLRFNYSECDSHTANTHLLCLTICYVFWQCYRCLVIGDIFIIVFSETSLYSLFTTSLLWLETSLYSSIIKGSDKKIAPLFLQ